MSTPIKPMQVNLPEEVSSYLNIESSFPDIYTSGKDLLKELAGKIAIMRMEIGIFPKLTLETNKNEIVLHEKEYKDIAERITNFRIVLGSINAQIERAISSSTAIPEMDVRSFTNSDQTTMRVYEYCKKSLPQLRDWHTQGTLLDHRFYLLIDHDNKNYKTSIAEFSQTVHPSGWSLGSLASSFSSYLFSQPEVITQQEAATADPVSTAEVSSPDKKKT